MCGNFIGHAVVVFGSGLWALKEEIGVRGERRAETEVVNLAIMWSSSGRD